MAFPPAGWRDQLQSASFRGVPFFVDTHEARGGRKAVVFEYVGGSTYVEDLGPRPRQFEVEAYIVGPDYFGERDSLMAALQNDAGAGTLVHPYLGSLTVEVQAWRLKESRREGGIAIFGIDFIETLAAPLMPSAGSSPFGLEDSADGALASLNDGFLSGFQTSLPASTAGSAGPGLGGFGAPALSLPGFALQSVSQVLVDWTAAVRSAMSPVVKTTAALANMKAQLDTLVRDSATLVRTPTLLLTRLGLVATSMLDWPDTPRLGITALLSAFNFKRTAPRPVATTATRLIEQSNQDQITLLLKGITIAQTARFAIQALNVPSRTISTARRVGQLDVAAGYDSYQDAIAVRAAITTAIDVLSDTAPDAVFSALQQVRADLAAAVPGSPNRLPQIVSVTPPVTVPALVLSQRLYGNLSLVDDLVARNSVAHPGFVPGGIPLQVLSNV